MDGTNETGLEALGKSIAETNRAIDQAKKSDARDSKGVSRYAKKRAWCSTNGCWGWEVPEPKPWK